MQQITKRGLMLGGAALAATLARPALAQAMDVAIIGFQMSSETHARAANAAAAAARAKGWNATVLNSEGSLPRHAEQLDTLIGRRPKAIIVCMGKPVEAEAQFQRAKAANVPVVTIMSGASNDTLFDIQVNEYKVGAEAALWLLGELGYQGNILTQRFEGNVGTRIRGKVLDVVLSENTGVRVLGSHTMARTASWRDDVRQGFQALLLRHGAQTQGIWASFDGQAFVIDDLLKARGAKKGQVKFVSIDGGAETYRRIADPESTLMATVTIPFEEMGTKAVDAVERIVAKGEPKGAITSGPYLFMDAFLVDGNNVRRFL
ncbi:LacI family transcriptional regulator [Falsiroseomonas bella]|uniref:LacI family transcriptional regulator n=1 Tax=Falsiroseomonas bella TaxID=2184016 RepID=A0A317FDF7_9PROT|nr:sugar ABC transporter substrate-binding protein [Falsiroseomonas bella]PWS36553.1 LacI family transcriptional regulator [Falsiroseomonas bella]